MSFPMDDIDAEELKAAEELRQVLIAEELLPSKHDDTHMMLRLLILYFDWYQQLVLAQLLSPAYEKIVIFLYDGADF